MYHQAEGREIAVLSSNKANSNSGIFFRTPHNGLLSGQTSSNDVSTNGMVEN